MVSRFILSVYLVLMMIVLIVVNYFSTSGVLSTAADLTDVVYESFQLRISARDHGDPPRRTHVDLVVVVDASIPYTDRHRGRQDLGDDEV